MKIKTFTYKIVLATKVEKSYLSLLYVQYSSN